MKKMKKITALVLALMMACLMTCAFAADADPLYTGEWYLKTMINGDETIDVAAMGLNGVMTLNADWTASMTGMGDDVTGTWKDDAENNKITVTLDGDDADVMLSDGELTVTAGDTKMIFTREAPAAGSETAEIKADATAEEFNGNWNCIALGVGSMKLDAATAKAAGQELPTLKFEDGAISMEGGQIAEAFSAFKMPLTFADGTYSFAIESASVSVKANILQDGTMALEFAAGETATTLYFAKAE